MTAAPPAGRLVYDADCGFCTSTATWLAAGAGGRVEIVSWQSIPDLGALSLDEAMVTARAYWLPVQGPLVGGASAIASALSAHGGPWGRVGRLLGSRVGSALADPVYRLVARHRHRMPGGTRACRVR